MKYSPRPQVVIGRPDGHHRIVCVNLAGQSPEMRKRFWELAGNQTAAKMEQAAKAMNLPYEVVVVR